MKKVLSIVLAALLITLPITQVLAQTAQQDSTIADTSSVLEERSQPRLGYPALNYGTVLVWQPVAVDPASILWEPSRTGDAASQGGLLPSTEASVLLLIVVAAAIIFVLYCRETRCINPS